VAVDALKRIAGSSPLARSHRFGRGLRPVARRDDLIHLGSDYGGWTVPERLFGPGSVCYCGGVGHDVTFDLALIERFGCEVQAFDPTPSAAKHVGALAEPRFHFSPTGIWHRDEVVEFYEPDYGDQNFSAVDLHGTGKSFGAPCRSIGSLMAERGDERLDLLKLDIEGSEYAVIRNICEERIPITVLCVEFHKDPGIVHMTEAARMLRGAGFAPVLQDGYDVTFVNEASAAIS